MFSIRILSLDTVYGVCTLYILLYCIINYETHGMAFAPLIPGQEIKYDDVGGVMTSTALQSLCEHLIRYSFAHSLACFMRVNAAVIPEQVRDTPPAYPYKMHEQHRHNTRYIYYYIRRVRRTAAQHQMLELNLFVCVCLSFANNTINSTHIKSI